MGSEPIDAVAALVADAGVGGRRLRQVVARLTEPPAPSLDDLVRDFAVPRRTVEALLRAAGPDLHDGVLPESYRHRLDLDGLHRPRPVPQMAGLIADAPVADRALDHVSATADTAARRAVWLDETFDLTGAHLVCVGDHDLTSLAVRQVNPGLRVTVVDVDDRLLEYIAAHDPGVECWHADLRFGLPPVVAGSADLVFTDPPYTPEGVQLFLGRGAQALGDRANGRLVMAYGFSPLTPALGLKVQRAVLDLDLAIEAVLPAFNRYHGAQAVGSASDLYVCRPTAGTWPALEKRLARTAVNIYTHGSQSLEGRTARSPAELFGAGPAARAGQADVDLTGDPGPWLLRALLAVNAERLTLLVPNRHPDLADAAGQAALRELVAGKYALRYRRSTPDPQHAIVEASAEAGDGGVAGWLLTHAHGKIGNVLREALVKDSGGTLTKNEARAAAAGLVAHPAHLDARLLDLPRSAVRQLLQSLR
ncbi:bis-aminopropyl spermidine synthase family protein [Dactylosporangium sp. AC04546]|uniref:bis-aminopropyl spermidine synthase family protein n=1 Tax=Dactylosporangium sp. AC04546 TaxID=2862460 RepID=UPI001EDF6E16|nr:bis-aminopropyl spermidine synthase family protein [Dactylosporangium sp. AC04546]WVK87563.1 bis-aminopropyl spermidine synthase family protein [Dactylosporangium sp. AC04546]